MKEVVDIVIIIVNYNGYKDTIECIDSIVKNENKLKYKIVVIDNNSQDNSVKELQKNSNITLLESKENKGFSAGNNLGIIYSKEHFEFKYILLLNNDTVITENSLYKLYTSTNLEDGIFSGKIMKYYDKTQIDCFGGDFSWKLIKAIYNYTYTENNLLFANTCTGAYMLISTSVFEKIGLLNEEYFMYYEDVDFCIRAKLNNFQIRLVEDSIIYHKGGSSTNGASPFAIKWNTRNRIIIFKKYAKNNKLFNKIYFFIYFTITRIIYILKYLISGKKYYLKAMIEGLIDGIKWKK